MFEAEEIIAQNNDWITLVFFGILLILSILKIAFNDRLYHTSVLFYFKKYLSIYYNKEKTNVFNIYQILFFTVQILAFSLLLYYILTFFKPLNEVFNEKMHLLIVAGVCVYFGARYLLGLFLATIFDLTHIYKRLVYEKISYNNNLILWLLPFLLLLTYSVNNQLFILKRTFIFFLFLVLIRYGVLLVNNKKLIFSNLFYFILYICALEIVPLVIILKLTN